MIYDDDHEDEDWEDDFDDEYSDYSDEDEAEVVECPACGADVYEDAEQCPACGDYIVHSSSIWKGRPTWWIALGLLGIFAVIIALASF
jgi:hypothetical protein